MQENTPNEVESIEEYSCPKDGCEYQSGSEKGVKIHHSKTHGESIVEEEAVCNWCDEPFTYDPKDKGGEFCSLSCYGKYCSEHKTGEDAPQYSKVAITCEWCHEEFRVKKSWADSRKFCSRECMGKHQSEAWAGEQSPVWDGGDATVSCSHCGDDYTVTPAKVERTQYCSKSCQYRHQSERYSQSGNPSWNGGPVELECEWCEDEYTTPKAYEERSRFCSIDCRSHWVSENLSGENSPHWNGGGGKRYREVIQNRLPGVPWNRTQARLHRKWDVCRLCDATESDREISLHHIIPTLAGGVNSEALLMPLCNSCHRVVEEYTKRFSDPLLADDSLLSQ